MNFPINYPFVPNIPNNMINNGFDYINEIFNKYNELENRIRKLEQRITKVENQNNNYQEPDKSLYMV